MFLRVLCYLYIFRKDNLYMTKFFTIYTCIINNIRMQIFPMIVPSSMTNGKINKVLKI